MPKPHDRIALVTGAGSGIGRALAIGCWSTAGAWCSPAAAPERCSEAIAAAGDPRRHRQRALAVPTDVDATPPRWRRCSTPCAQRFGRLDLLFNNAGTGAPAVPMEDLHARAVAARWSTSTSPARSCAPQQAFRLMKAQTPQGGRIINNGSISAHAPRPNSAPYTATKHAITGLTKSTALDGRAYDIACGQIDIGNAATEMTERMTSGVPQADGSDRGRAAHGRAATSADAVLHMASLPLDANVLFMTVMATKMPFVGPRLKRAPRRRRMQASGAHRAPGSPRLLLACSHRPPQRRTP